MSNKTISDLIGADPLAQIEHELSIDRIISRFSGLIPEDICGREVLVLRPFTESPPLTYWDESTVAGIIDLLENDLSRTFAAIDRRSDSLQLGIENLHRESPTKDLQDAYSHGQARELLTIANYFLPEYLYLTEHVLGNLSSVIWSVRKKGDVNGKFILKNAVSMFKSQGLSVLTEGYDDLARNAIAHGKVRFTGLEIEFGSANPHKLSSLDFLYLFDDLARTCVCLCLALQLFWLRNKHSIPRSQKPPLSLAVKATAGMVTRDGLRFLGGIESFTRFAGRQLHVALAVDTKSRNQIILESSRVARELLNQGATGFDRFLFEIDSDQGVPSLVIILPKILEELLEENSPMTRFPEILADTQLLWCNEPRYISSIRAWYKVFKSSLKKLKRLLLTEWQSHGLLPAKGRYVILGIQNLSVSGIARVEVRAHLTHPSDGEDRVLIENILTDLTKIGRRRFVKSRSGIMDKGIPWPKRPSYVFLQLFRRNGPSRWLQRGGWQGGNIVAIGERVWGDRKHVLVKNPQAELGRIRVQYEIDKKEASNALKRLNDVVASIREQHESRR